MPRLINPVTIGLQILDATRSGLSQTDTSWCLRFEMEPSLLAPGDRAGFRGGPRWEGVGGAMVTALQ